MRTIALEEHYAAQVLLDARAKNAPLDLDSLTSAASGRRLHIDTALYVVRIILGGVFDCVPCLQLVLRYLGETLPFMLPRFETSGCREQVSEGRS